VIVYGLSAIVWLACVAATGVVAQSKDRGVLAWMILAAFFTLIALIVVAVLPERRAVPGR